MGGGVHSRERPFMSGDDLERGLRTAQTATREADRLADAARRRAEMFYDRVESDAARIASLPEVVRPVSNIRAQAEAAQRRAASQEAFFNSLIQEQPPPVIATVEQIPQAQAQLANIQSDIQSAALLTPRTAAQIANIPAAVAKMV
jgi:hypothetical protein